MAIVFNTLEEYETFIQKTIKPWPPSHCAALAAAMAERWFHTYQLFSTSEQWGNPAILRQGLDAIWDTLQDQSMTVNWSSLSNQIHQNTPHLDDFDANEALCVCVMIQYAIDCYTKKEIHMAALMAVLSGLEAVQPDLLTVEKVPLRFWKQAAIDKEIEKQLSLIEKISTIKDAKNIHAELRPFLAKAEILGVIRKKRETKSGPVGLTNQQAFERYQKVIALDNKSAARGLDPLKHPEFATSLFIAAWTARYRRRKQIITGEYGTLIDQIAVNLLIEKNRFKDRAETHTIEWDENTRQMIDRFYKNKLNGLDADTPESPHSYGPSLRRLWIEAKHQNLADIEAWKQIQTWARSEHAKKRNSQDKSGSKALQDHLAKSIHWNTTDNPEIPWQTQGNDTFLQIQLNDFPDDMMYSLLINGQIISKFHGWPKTWTR